MTLINNSISSSNLRLRRSPVFYVLTCVRESVCVCVSRACRFHKKLMRYAFLISVPTGSVDASSVIHASLCIRDEARSAGNFAARNAARDRLLISGIPDRLGLADSAIRLSDEEVRAPD